jgi:hypothetical protein
MKRQIAMKHKEKGRSMTPDEKLTFFEKFDFSKTGLLKRSTIDIDDPKIELYHDIAGMVQVLLMKLSEVADGAAKEVKAFKLLQDTIYKCYGWLQMKYQSIEWSDIDSDDPEFSIFFKMKKSIDDLGHSIDSFLETSRRHLGNGSKLEEYTDIEKQIKKMGELMQLYRRTKESLKKQVAFEESMKTR